MEAHPAVRVPTATLTNPSVAATQSATSESSPNVNGDIERSSSARGRGFSFLRRSKSSDGRATPSERGPEVRRSASGGRKLVRRRKTDKEADRKRQLELEMETANKEMPRMPSYHMLPSISNPYLADSSLQLQDSPTTPQQQTFQKPTSPKRFGYNPNAFYQKRQNTMDRPPTAIPVPPIPEGEASPPRTAYSSNAERGPPATFDPFARTESMTNRGRMSYASSAISQGPDGAPRRLRRRKDPTPFNILVVGAKNCGKTSFIEFLRSSLTRRSFSVNSNVSPPRTANTEYDGSFKAHYLKTDLDGEPVGITMYDSKGLEKHLVDLQLRELAAFVESKFQETFNEEQKVVRATGVKDTHIHCVFLILDPARLDSNIAASSPRLGGDATAAATLASRARIVGGLDEDLDVDVLRALQGKTTIIPVISKADTITTAHMTYLKRTVHDSLKKVKFDPLEALNLDEEDVDFGNGFHDAREGAQSALSDRDSSIFQDAEEGEAIINGEGEAKHLSSTIPAKSTLTSSGPPQHDEIRVSHLSETIDLPTLPMSIISPDVYDPGTVGRQFPWGFADPYNSDHCDFSRLRDSVFSAWRAELREASRERWYEGWRTSQMKRRGHSSPQYVKPTYNVGSARAVSGTSSYGTVPQSMDVVVNQPQAVSANEIGIAVGDQPTSLAYRDKPANGKA